MALVQQTTDTGSEVIKAFGSCYNQIVKSDLIKAAITAFFSAFWSTALLQLTQLFTGVSFPTMLQLKMVLLACIGSGLGALTRKYKTNSVGQPFKKDPPKVDNSAATAQ